MPAFDVASVAHLTTRLVSPFLCVSGFPARDITDPNLVLTALAAMRPV